MVVNWFQNFVSLWSETVLINYYINYYRLWIGFKILYLCGLKQLYFWLQKWNCVVNWFQNFVSLWSETVALIYTIEDEALWIGFKILYLCGLKQFEGVLIDKNDVVNWFQNFVSLWSETVIFYISLFLCLLWIGFKILYLCGLKQSEILSNIDRIVVNWFQNFVSLWSETVAIPGNATPERCELVSKFCIFVVWNSYGVPKIQEKIVVNWFQNFVSLWSETVYRCTYEIFTSCELVSKFCIFVVWNSPPILWTTSGVLWIGFKILYLCGLKQSLLLQFTIFTVVNWFQNFVSLWSETVYSCLSFVRLLVVNWFQNFVSLWSETVYDMQQVVSLLLWIGFKILYLCGLKQFQAKQGFCFWVVNWFQNFVSLWSETVNLAD